MLDAHGPLHPAAGRVVQVVGGRAQGLLLEGGDRPSHLMQGRLLNAKHDDLLIYWFQLPASLPPIRL